MKEIKEAVMVKTFRIEDESGLFMKITAEQAREHDKLVESLPGDNNSKAIRALHGSTLSWFKKIED